jgi:hypothetical protein
LLFQPEKHPGRREFFRENVRMTGPGQYLPDPTEGITRVEDLPQPQLVARSRNYRRRRCPRCRRPASRLRSVTRALHDLGDLAANRPRDLVISFSQHRCFHCGKYFQVGLSDLADAHSLYARRVVALALRLVAEDGLPYRAASWHLWRDHRVFVPFATIQNWVEAGGKKGRRPDHRGLSR